MAYWRSKKLLASARDAPCMYCDASGDYAGVVAAHANGLGKGLGIKCPDYYVAFLCFECHTKVDQGMLSREDRDEIWYTAYLKTISYLFENKIVKVA